MDEQNFLIHQQAHHYQWSGDCFLSIKSFYRGVAHYRVKQREYTIDDTNYLVLNECTKYTVTLDSDTRTESFCVFFSSVFVTRAVSEWMATEEQRLDFSVQQADGPRLIERTYEQKGAVSSLLLQGRKSRITRAGPLEKEAFYYSLLYAILGQNSTSLGEAGRLMFKKKSTREELYRRVQYAKDFIDGHYTESITLKQIAQAAMLSENHLLRAFRQLFGTSPFRYITEKKLSRAKRQIIETDQRIAEIVADAGYTSLSNFSCYFKHAFGVSPTALRKKVIRRK